MKNISLNRICDFAKYEYFTTKRRQSTMLLSLTLCMLLLKLFFTVITPNSYNSITESVISIISFFSYAWWIMYSASIMADMQQRQARLQILMIPVTMLEKFIVKFINTTVIFLLYFIVTSFVSDILYILIELVFNPKLPAIWFSMEIFKVFIGVLSKSEEMSIIGVLLVVSIHGFFTLCGCLFNRKAPLFGFILSGMIFMSVSITLIFIGNSLEKFHLLNYVSEVLEIDPNLFYSIFCGLMSAFIVTEYFIAYKLFKNSQLIGRKYINI